MKTPTESDVYDRQIRLWGAESQQKMMKARVLYIHVTGVSAEILKNLVLAGIRATLCDDRPAVNMVPHFLTPFNNNNNNNNNNNTTSTLDPPPNKKTKIQYDSVAHAVQPLVQDLNPLLGDCPILSVKPQDLTLQDLEPFQVIVASQLSLKEAVRLSQLSAQLKRQFYLVDCFGWNGAAIMDLGNHITYRPEQGKQLLDPQPLYSNADTDSTKTATASTGAAASGKPLPNYVSLKELVQIPLHQCINRFHKVPPSVYIQYRCLLEYQEQTGQFPSTTHTTTFDDTIWPKYLTEQKVELSDTIMTTLAKAGMAQLAPVCAVLGGMLGNEIIKVISGKGEPANNTILFDGKACKAWTFLVQPPSA